MSELKQKLYKYELAKVGFNDADFSPTFNSLLVNTKKPFMIEINDRGDVFYGRAYKRLALDTIVPIARKVQESTDMWKKSYPVPMERLSNFNIFAEYNNVVLAARDDVQHGRGFYFATLGFNSKRTKLISEHYTEDYDDAKTSFVICSGLVQEEKILTQDLAVDIIAAIDFYMKNDPEYSLGNQLYYFKERLCQTFPIIKQNNESLEQEEKETEKSMPSPQKLTLQEKLDEAKEKAKETDTKKDTRGDKPKKRNGQEVE